MYNTKDATYCLAVNETTGQTGLDPPIQPNYDTCGVPNLRLSKRVVGGTETKPQEFPWIVALAYNGQLIGTGSLISGNVVLTSAQRLKQLYDSSDSQPDIKVLIGAHDVTKSESSKRVFRVNQIIFHPKFGYNTPQDNDFALLELKPAADGSYPTQRPICLPRTDTPYSVGTALTGAGWGRTSTYSSGSTVLRKVTLHLSKRSECSQTYRYSVTDSMVCATDENKDMCLGDTGAPLMAYFEGRMYLYGVYSWQSSEGCATGKPSVFGDVRYTLEWIRDVTNNAIRTA
ncbi:unnamed protein product [Medioppia subpectinata]|uniref:Peptidase S1 domain-containing protein n=1 Tax=Medioppia subpectinata TaxID=1979941 RepID=A0A7R9Q6E7_9ACAR|nr:unnamed protein product [Medioppia subpectinata]CAG2114453.1 unnamed protein product [Medioppia subpectinata]